MLPVSISVVVITCLSLLVGNNHFGSHVFRLATQNSEGALVTLNTRALFVYWWFDRYDLRLVRFRARHA